MIYLVTYDLRRPGQGYQPLYDALKTCGASIRPLESVWLIDTNLTAQGIYDRVRPHIDQNDRLLVTVLAADAQGWLSKSDWEWINSRTRRAA